MFTHALPIQKQFKYLLHHLNLIFSLNIGPNEWKPRFSFELMSKPEGALWVSKGRCLEIELKFSDYQQESASWCIYTGAEWKATMWSLADYYTQCHLSPHENQYTHKEQWSVLRDMSVARTSAERVNYADIIAGPQNYPPTVKTKRSGDYSIRGSNFDQYFRKILQCFKYATFTELKSRISHWRQFDTKKVIPHNSCNFIRAFNNDCLKFFPRRKYSSK